MKIWELLGAAVGLFSLWAIIVALLFAFASTIKATDTKEARDRTGKMACLWALVLTAVYALERWIF
jgi:hypothetical protein